MTDLPLVSVVLPAYNRAGVLPRCIRSILAQTYRNLELIVIDDASTDRTAEAVQGIGDPRIRYIRRDRNGGAGAARNDGIRNAQGELVAFQDSDDEWLITKLEQQVALMQTSPPRVGLVCGGYLVGQEGHRPRYIGMTPEQRRGDFELDLLTAFRFIPPTWLVRRSVLVEAGPFDERLPPREDWDLAFRLHDLCDFAAVDEPVLVKHRSADGIDSNFPARMRGYEGILERHAGRYAAHPRLLGRHYRELGKLQCEHRDTQSGRRSFLRAIRIAPPNLSAVILWTMALGGRRVFLALRSIRRGIQRLAAALRSFIQ